MSARKRTNSRSYHGNTKRKKRSDGSVLDVDGNVGLKLKFSNPIYSGIILGKEGSGRGSMEKELGKNSIR